jgi:hypothetical protein
MKSTISSLALLLVLVGFFQANGQGCVAVRNMSSCSINYDSLTHNSWQISLNYRYFRSYKHFRGDHEEKDRVKRGTEVINNDNSVILGLTYHYSPIWSFSIALPYLNIDRSSLYEHYGNSATSNPDRKRFHTQSKGLGDIRIMAYYNLSLKHTSNLSLGAGIKLPSGNYRYKDYFHKRAADGSDSVIYKVVDQSIQLGDGGWGAILEANYVMPLGGYFRFYANGVYMLNPRNTNGVLRSNNPTSIPHGNEFSVSDQFFARSGISYSIGSWQLAMGGRIEGIPARDLIGQNDGFRRPGHIVSAEPSLNYHNGSHMISINFPIALYRNRIRSVYDVQRSKETNQYQHGDAAFADWLISVTYSYKL